MTDSGKGFIRHRRLLSKCSVNSLIELSPTSLHRSDSYSKNPSYSYSKAVLLNRVVVGRGKILFNDDTSLTEPPAGYDSVSYLTTVAIPTEQSLYRS